MSRWPIQSWTFRFGTPAAAIVVPKVWRRSWKRWASRPAEASARLKRRPTPAVCSGSPVSGWPKTRAVPERSVVAPRRSRGDGYLARHRHRARGAPALRRLELPADVVAADADVRGEPVDVSPAQGEELPTARARHR